VWSGVCNLVKPGKACFHKATGSLVREYAKTETKYRDSTTTEISGNH